MKKIKIKAGKLWSNAAKTEEVLKREDELIKKSLKDVYQDDSGQVPDLSKIEKTQHGWWWQAMIFTVITLVILTIISWIGFFWFSEAGQKFSGKNVEVRVEGPLGITSGQETAYSITITNNEKVDIYSLNLKLSYPRTFSFATSSPQPFADGEDSWNFSVLKSGESQKVNLQGIYLGDKNSPQSLKATLTFRPANFNADFKQEAVSEIQIVSSAVTLAIEGSAKAVADQKAQYSFKIKNNSERDFTNLQLVAIYPSSFTYKEASLEPEKNQNNGQWQIKTLKAGEEKEVKVAGSFGSDFSAGQELKAQIKIKGAKDEYYILDEQMLTTETAGGLLSLDLIVNNSSDNQPINPGETLNYSFTYKNISGSDLGNLKITAILDSKILDWSTLQDENGGQINGNRITWSSQEIKKLVSLSPQEEGKINFSLKTASGNSLNGLVANDLKVVSKIEAEFTPAEKSVLPSQTASRTIVNEINSNVSITAQGRYFAADGSVIGAGPLPPKVGETTSYQIIWNVDNSLHELTGLKMTTILPTGVIWLNQSDFDAGLVAYSATERKVTWNLNRLPKTAGRISVRFLVSITPGAELRNKVLTLTSEANFSATDKQTGAVIVLSTPAITTNLIGDMAAAGKGTVE